MRHSKAVALDDRDAVAHFALGRVHLVRREYDAALDELETSVSLNPSLAQAHCGLGDALTYSERLEESLRHFDEAIRLSYSSYRDIEEPEVGDISHHTS